MRQRKLQKGIAKRFELLRHLRGQYLFKNNNTTLDTATISSSSMVQANSGEEFSSVTESNSVEEFNTVAESNSVVIKMMLVKDLILLSVTSMTMPLTQ